MFKKIFITSLLFIFMHQAFAVDIPDSEVIFRCQTPILSLDLNFEQGSEVYLDLYYNKNQKKAAMVSRPAVGPSIEILNLSESIKASVDVNSSSAYFSWQAETGELVQASMVYIGGPWGFHMDLSKIITDRDPSLKAHKEIELFCKESSIFEEYFIK